MLDAIGLSQSPVGRQSNTWRPFTVRLQHTSLPLQSA
jgi:hypothetical protein